MHSRDRRARSPQGKVGWRVQVSLLLTVVNQGVESSFVGEEISLGAGLPVFSPLLGQCQAFFVLGLASSGFLVALVLECCQARYLTLLASRHPVKT